MCEVKQCEVKQREVKQREVKQREVKQLDHNVSKPADTPDKYHNVQQTLHPHGTNKLLKETKEKNACFFCKNICTSNII